MAGEVNLPTVVDDDGSLTVGTPFNKAFRDSCETAINAKIRSATYPTVSAANVIDEVVDARGNMASIGARFGQTVDADGNVVGALDPSDVRNGLVLGNLLANPEFTMWSKGDSSAPDYWGISGAGAAIARTGDGPLVYADADDFASQLAGYYRSLPAGASVE